MTADCIATDQRDNYRQHCAQRKPPVFNLLRGRFWGCSPRRGVTLHRWGLNLARRRGPFTPIGATARVQDPKNWNLYSNLTKMWNINAPQGRIPCAIFTKFAEFVGYLISGCVRY